MKNKTGLVLEGGGAKGAYQLGSYKALQELGFEFDYIVGTSIGSLNGALFAQNDAKLSEKIWRNLNYSDFMDFEDKRFDEFINEDLSIKTLGKKISVINEILSNKGLDTTPFKELLDEYIDEEKIRNSKVKYGLVTVDFTNLKPIEIFLEDMPKGSVKKYIYASCNLFFFKQEPIDGKILLDGGFYNNNPISMLKGKCDKIINIRLFPGRFKPIEYENAEIIAIVPSEELSGIMNFNRKYINFSINLGYFDTYKKFKNLRGEKYYIKDISPNFGLKILQKLYEEKKHESKRGKYENLRKFLDDIFSFVFKDKKDSENADFDDLLIRILEKFAQKFGIERFKIYDVKELSEKIINCEKFSEVSGGFDLEKEIIRKIANEYNK